MKCPLKFNTEGISEECDRAQCEWWTTAYTTELFQERGCAIVILAKKNSDGKIPV